MEQILHVKLVLIHYKRYKKHILHNANEFADNTSLRERGKKVVKQ